MKKYIISTVSGLIVLVAAYTVSNFILNFNNSEESLVSESSKLVKVITVKNSIQSYLSISRWKNTVKK